MNKLLGFYELRQSSLPAIPWKEFQYNTELNNNKLWTIRSAVFRGADLNLPRKVGCSGIEGMKFATKLKRTLGDNGIVIYYPYFVAKKSGTLNIYNNRIVIEGVKDDLWNLVTFSKRDVTIIFEEDSAYIDGDEHFLNNQEIDEILSYIPRIRHMFRGYLLEGKSVLIEWSFARECDIDKNEVGNNYLVFYEARTV